MVSNREILDGDDEDEKRFVRKALERRRRLNSCDERTSWFDAYKGGWGIAWFDAYVKERSTGGGRGRRRKFGGIGRG